MVKQRKLGFISGTKGFFFTLDGILAASLMLLLLILLPKIFLSQAPIATTVFNANDAVNVLAEMKVNEVNSTYIQALISNNTIERPDQSVLEQIGEFWAVGEFNNAANLSNEVLGSVITNYELVIGDDVITGTSNPTTQLVAAKRMVSGIERSKPKLGFSARAFATQTRKNNTFILLGDVITSSVKKVQGGNNQNEVNSTYRFTLPDNLTITDAYWFIQASYSDNKLKAYVNDVFLPGSGATGSVLLEDLESYFQPGANTAEVRARYGAGGEEAGEDGSSHMVITYTTNSTATLPDLNKKEISEVNSYTTIRYKKPIMTLGNINNIDVNLNLVSHNASMAVILDGIEYNISRKNSTSNNIVWSNSEISNGLAPYGVTYANLTGRYFWIRLDIGEYQSREDLGEYRAILDDSYVQLATDQSEEIYGKLDYTQIIPATSWSNRMFSDFYNNVEWEYNVSTGFVPLIVDSQLAWLYTASTDPNQQISSNGITLYQHPPQPLVVELARYGFDSTQGGIINGTNYYNADFGTDYGVDPYNSLAFATYLVDALVPYGEVFVNESDAVADANQRLIDMLGEGIVALGIGNETLTVGNVPSLWGPTLVEVRTWQ
jgi:hypothetical protein